MRDRDTQRVYRLYDFSNAQLIRPGVAYGVPGKVNSAGKLYPVIESVRLDRKPRRVSAAPVPADGAGGSTASSPVPIAPVCAGVQTGARSGVKTGRIAALLDRRQQSRPSFHFPNRRGDST
jgi:hypothetical protein